MGPLATALMICTALGAGCGGPPAAHAAPRPASHFTISYERSGGLRADPRSLTVTPGRHAAAKGRRLPSRPDSVLTARFRIGVGQVKRLRAALERARFTAIRAPKPETVVCADCFSYEILYRGHDVTFSDATLPRRLRPVVNRLEALIEAHLPFH
jgi:hypothetical protein